MTKPFQDFDLLDFWKDSDYARKEYIEGPPTDIEIAFVERELGYRLPASYVELCRTQNGGIPKRTCFRTDKRTSWADDHIAITAIKAIGRTKIWSLCGQLGSQHQINEWEYPPIGIYFADCPSAGHDMVCLDYSSCGPSGEPRVVHVDQELDYRVTLLAPDFEAFIKGLEPEEAFPLDEEAIASAVANAKVKFNNLAASFGDQNALKQRPWWRFW